jgi:hypothetical protein
MSSDSPGDGPKIVLFRDWLRVRFPDSTITAEKSAELASILTRVNGEAKMGGQARDLERIEELEEKLAKQYAETRYQRVANDSLKEHVYRLQDELDELRKKIAEHDLTTVWHTCCPMDARRVEQLHLAEGQRDAAARLVEHAMELMTPTEREPFAAMLAWIQDALQGPPPHRGLAKDIDGADGPLSY